MGPRGERIIDDSFYIIFNAHYEPVTYKLPKKKYGCQWTRILDTSQGNMGQHETFEAGSEIQAPGRSVLILFHPTPREQAEKE
jgi:glycogen operon protein